MNDLIKQRVPLSSKLTAVIIKAQKLCSDMIEKSKSCRQYTGNLDQIMEFEDIK
jgi:hypothetical protein